MYQPSHSQKNVFIQVIACPRRGLDAQKMSTYFTLNNYNIVNDPRKANYIVLFTCGYANQFTERCLKNIRKLQKYDSKLIIAGCLPSIANEKIKEIFNGKTVTTEEIDKIDEIFKDNKIKFKDVADEHFIWRNYNPTWGLSVEPYTTLRTILKKIVFIGRMYKYFKERVLVKTLGRDVWYIRNILTNPTYWIQISRGCNYKCSYCSIKFAIGPLKSKSLEKCIREFKNGLAAGYKKFGLEADDLGTYGIDINKSLSELLDRITKIDGEYTLALENIHAFWFNKYVNDLIMIVKRKKINSLLLSIQSGSNQVLHKMRRQYDIEKLLNSIHRLKESCPNIRIGVEFIIGFPGETWNDFLKTLKMMQSVRFDYGKIARFSAVEGTEAYDMEPKVSNRDINKRARFMLKFLRGNNYYAWHSYRWNGISFDSKY